MRRSARWTDSLGTQATQSRAFTLYWEQVGWKGVCEPGNIRALTVDVTHKATAEKREGVALVFFSLVAFGEPLSCVHASPLLPDPSTSLFLFLSLCV